MKTTKTRKTLIVGVQKTIKHYYQFVRIIIHKTARISILHGQCSLAFTSSHRVLEVIDRKVNIVFTVTSSGVPREVNVRSYMDLACCVGGVKINGEDSADEISRGHDG